MDRLKGFEDHRYVGDKRTQRVYDVDEWSGGPEVLAELLESEQYLCFGPDTLAEARNRGYKLATS